MNPRNARRRPAERRAGKASKRNEENRGTRCLAMQTALPTLEPVFRGDGMTFTVPTTPPDHTATLSQLLQQRDFSLHAACLFNVDTNGANDKRSLNHYPVTCVFLYDLGSSSHRSSISVKVEPGLEYIQGSDPFRNILGGTAEEVRVHSPARYSSFPANQFFSRIFRPHLVSTSPKATLALSANSSI